MPSHRFPVKPGDTVKCPYCNGTGYKMQETAFGTPTGRVAVCSGCDGTREQVVQEEAVVETSR